MKSLVDFLPERGAGCNIRVIAVFMFSMVALVNTVAVETKNGFDLVNSPYAGYKSSEQLWFPVGKESIAK